LSTDSGTFDPVFSGNPDERAPAPEPAGDKWACEDRAGIDALAELAAAGQASSVPLTVHLSALTDHSIRRPVTMDRGIAAGLTIRPRVLLVEDNPMNRLMTGVLFDRLGLEHVAVGCAEEAILRFAREAFDAIMIDVEMDGLAGLATARAITALAGAAAPPLVALGRADLDEDVLEEAGFSAVADTPLDTRGLAQALILAVENSLIDSDGH